ncbi:MAG: hypothetical protein Q9171_001916 [Xanthocarpia ochracea]
MNLSLIDPFILAQDYPDALTGKVRSGHAACIRFNRKGDFLASGRVDGTVVIFDIETNGVARKLRGHTRQIQALSWSGDGRYLLSSSQDWKCILWDLHDGTKLRTVRFEAPVYIAELHPTNPFLFVASLFEDQPLLVDISSRVPLKHPLSSVPKRPKLDRPDLNEKQALQDARQSTCVTVFTTQGDHIIAGTNKGWLNIIEVGSREIVHSTRLCNGIIILLRLTASGRDMVSNASDRVIRTTPIPNLSQAGLDMDTVKIEVEHKFQDVVNRLSWNHVAFSSTGDYVAASTFMNHDIYVWERGHGSLVKILEGPKEELGVIEWHPHRPFVAACGIETGRVYLWSIITPQRWSALAPDFAEVEENVEYVEREDEFDIHPIEEIHKRRLDLEDEALDVLTIDPVKGDSVHDVFSMPVLLDIMDSESEEEIVAVGPGTMRRKSPGEGREWMNGGESGNNAEEQGLFKKVVTTAAEKTQTSDECKAQDAHGPSLSHSALSTGDRPMEQEPIPPFNGNYGNVDLTQDGLNTKARVGSDGRVDISINQQSSRLSNLLVPALRSQLDLQQTVEPTTDDSEQIRPIIGSIPEQARSPALNVVIHVVGSRGDVQPFVALGKVLKEEYGHRIRLATHPTFRSFVEENGLEFFSIGGDPAELMAFMVKNPGLMPGIDSLKSGDIGKRRKGMYEIVQGCWRSCIEIGDGTGIMASDDRLDTLDHHEHHARSGPGSSGAPPTRPFVADAIIANPPSFAGIHCAEKLGIPLHLMFTMPWSPTQAFPHPLANIQNSNADQSITNFMSYALVEMMTWQGLGDVINRFREKSLGLEPVSLMWAPGMASRLRIPYTYCWSPALIPKPKDWGNHISVSGFYFLSLASSFKPDHQLLSFLEAGPPPVYIGFGSIVVDDPNDLTRMIFDAVKKTGQRALVSKGWGGLGADSLDVPQDVFMLGNVPHDWLFKHVSCVVHHGGAGTTAAGIAAGKPTVVVPFFGDQPFWGSMVAKAGAGPWPIPYKQLTSDKLAASISEALKPEALHRAEELGQSISQEKGTYAGAKDYQNKLDVDSLRCSVAPSRAAAWRVKRTNVRLSPFAASLLAKEGLLDFGNLKLYRPREYDSEDGPWDPITGATSAIMGTMGSMMMGVADLPVEFLRALRIKPSEKPSTGADSEAAARSTTNESVDSLSVEDDHISPSSSLTSIENHSAASSVRTLPSVSSQNQDETRSTHHRTSSNPPLSQRSSTPTSGWSLGMSMAQTLGGSASRRSRSPSQDRSSVDSPTNKSLADSQLISLDTAVGTSKGIGRIVGAGLKSPMDFTLGIARGFHNAPKLYGDESVRHPDKVTGIQSGLKTAGKEFGYGVYDGVTGLFTQPINGAKQEGVPGFIKGFGKGVGGFFLKPSAAFMSLPAYTFSGIYKELQKHFGSSVQNYIVAARMAQGYEDLAASTEHQRLDVVKRWHAAQIALHKERDQHKLCGPHQQFNYVFLRVKNATHATLEERKKKTKREKSQKDTELPTHGASAREHDENMTSSPQQRAFSSDLRHTDSATFEEAIEQSVKATSHGNPEEDAMIERAIRASVMELQAASKSGDENRAIQKAIQASVAEATKARETTVTGNDSAPPDHEARLELALQRSMSLQPKREDGIGLGDDDSGVDTDDDENIKTALERSKSDYQKPPQLEEQLPEKEKQLDRARTEEEIVLEFVKKQSLLEDDYRRSLASTADTASKASRNAA